MTMNTTTYFLFFVCVCIGVALGGWIQRIQNRRSTRPLPEPLPPPSPAPDQLAAPVQDSLASPGDVRLFGAWRTLSGRVWLEMDGGRLNNREALQPEQRRRLVSLLVDLRPWLENTPPVAASATPVQAPRPVLAPVRKASVAAKEESKAVPEPKSILAQIDEVLQEKLLLSPYKDRQIGLAEGPGGVVLVMDGLKKYEGIDAVPEAEVRALIRQAVVEWEKKPV